MRAIRQQLDEVDATVWSGKESPDIRPFVIGGIVPQDVDQALVRVASFNFGKKLRRADPVDRGWLDKGCVEGLKVERTMDINAAPARRGRDPWI